MKIYPHDYTKFSNEYAELEIEGTFYLAFRDIANLLNRYAKGKKALDYGCGAGRSTRYLKKLGYDTIGVDISPDMLKHAQLEDGFGEYYQIKSGQLPFDDMSFEIVFSSFVLLEVPSKEEMKEILLEMERVTKKNGTIVIVTSIAESYKGNWISFSFDFPENMQHLEIELGRLFNNIGLTGSRNFKYKKRVTSVPLSAEKFGYLFDGGNIILFFRDDDRNLPPRCFEEIKLTQVDQRGAFWQEHSEQKSKELRQLFGSELAAIEQVNNSKQGTN